MAYYVLDENNNKIEALDKQGVLAAINQAAADGTLQNLVANAAFIDKLKCCVSGETFKIAFVTQAKYNELFASGGVQPNTYYFIIDDTAAEDINEQLEILTNTVNELVGNVGANLFKVDRFEPTNFNYNSCVYDKSKSGVTSFDISSLLRFGKTFKDTIGLSGRIKAVDSQKVETTIPFNFLWVDYESATIFKGESTSGGTTLKYVDFILNSSNRLYLNGVSEVNVLSGSNKTFEYAYIYNLNIYYK